MVSTNAAPPPARASLEDGCVTGAVPVARLHAGEIGVVLDGVLRHTAVAAPGDGDGARFTFPLTGPLLPGTFDLEELATGRRLLPAPLAVSDGFMLGAVGCDGTMLTGSFTLDWAPHPFLPVAFMSGDAAVARGVADRFPPGGTGGGVGAVYRFRLPLASLLAGIVRLTPVVGGVRREEHGRDLGCPVAGYVDTVEGADVSGWLVDTTAPDRPVRVDVRRGGRVVASADTDRARPDVAQAIPGAERCGFTVRIPFSERMRGDAEPYRLVVGGTDTTLHDGSVRIEGVVSRLNRLDGAAGATLTGWALDGAVDGPAPVEARHNGRVVGTAMADLYRADLAAEGLGAPGLPLGHCMFVIRLGPAEAALAGQPIEVWAAGHPVEGSPRVLEPNPNITRFRDRRARVRPEVLPRLRTVLDRQAGRRSVSLVLCARGADPDVLNATLAGVAGQWCSRWELLCVHDGFAEPAAARVVAQFARRDPRVRMIPADASAGEAAFLQAGIAAARSGYVAILPPEARPEPDAVYHLLRAIRDTGADVVFTDAYAVDPVSGQALGIEARTAFSADRFRTAPFWPDLLCLRSSLAQSIGGDAEGIAFAARAFAAAQTVAHVPAVAVGRPPSRPAGERAAAEPFAGQVLVVVAGPGHTGWTEDALGVRCRTVVLEGGAGPNEAVAREGAGCAAILLVSAGVIPPGADTMNRLLSLVARPDVAAAGPVLAQPGGQVVAAGLVLGVPGVAVPGLAGLQASSDGSVRNVSALPAAFLLVRTDAWADAGGFDPAMGTLASADLCLRMEAAGRDILLDGGSVVVTTADLPAPDDADIRRFTDRHGPALRHGDRWYNPFLDDSGSWLLRSEGKCRTTYPARVVSRKRVTPPPPAPGPDPEPDVTDGPDGGKPAAGRAKRPRKA